MFQMLDILQRIGIGLGRAGAKSAVDSLCKEQDQEVLHLKKKAEVFFILCILKYHIFISWSVGIVQPIITWVSIASYW